MITAPITAYTPVSYPMMPATNQQQGAFVQQQPQAQAPGYIYNYPTTSCYTPQSTAKSQFNGVNIEIINPTGNTAATPAPTGYYTQPIYPAATTPMPVAMPAPMPMPAAPVQYPTSQAVVQAPQAVTPQVTPQAAAPVQTPVAPVATPQVAPQQAPVVPEPQIQTPVAAAPVAADPAINPATFAGKLQTADLDAQRTAIEEVAELVKTNDTAGPILLDTQIFDALVGIVNTDTTALQGPTPEVEALRGRKNAGEQLTPAEEQLALTPTPLDKAEENKKIALYTIAFMQERLNNELEKRGNQALELKDLPQIETVINAAKSNPSPWIREAALASLSHIAKPQYSADLKTIFDLAAQDEHPAVQQKAQACLAKLN